MEYESGHERSFQIACCWRRRTLTWTAHVRCPSRTPFALEDAAWPFLIKKKKQDKICGGRPSAINAYEYKSKATGVDRKPNVFGVRVTSRINCEEAPKAKDAAGDARRTSAIKLRSDLYIYIMKTLAWTGIGQSEDGSLISRCSSFDPAKDIEFISGRSQDGDPGDIVCSVRDAVGPAVAAFFCCYLNRNGSTCVCLCLCER